MKYPIDKQFYPYALFTPPIRNAKIASFMGSFLSVPRWLFRQKGLSVRRETIPGYQEQPVEVLLLEPEGLEVPAPCLVYYHGGGFLFPAAGYHYKLAAEYALRTPCKVVFVQYRLTPKYPFPIPPEDCYGAYRWVLEQSAQLGIHRAQIAVGGDSAGGALAAAAAQMARDRGLPLPRFQLLVYPVTDRRMASDSNRRFPDTPMWNSKLSEKMWEAYLPDENIADIAYASPLEAKSFAGLPPAYVETAEFDCLRDEGIAYGNALNAVGIPVQFYDTRGTVHGFDIVEKAPITCAAVEQRIRYMRRSFAP